MSELSLLPTPSFLSKVWARTDKAALAIVLILLALTAFDPVQAGDSFAFLIQQVVHVAPFLLASIFIAAYASASGADNLIAKAFSGRQMQMIVAAALMGGLSPFCSCGVIPLIAALLGMGVPLAPVMAFWLASPVMDPTMFILTAGTLGTEFAMVKTMAAIGIGLLGGFSIHILMRRGLFSNPLRDGVGNGGCGAASVRSNKPVAWAFWHDEARRKKFGVSSVQNLLFLGKWLALAFLLESLMLAYMPDGFIRSIAGDAGILTILGATLVGIPAYLNGYAALPLVGGLIDQGMAPGAGLAFLVGGGVTSIPAAIAVFALARLPVFVAYVTIAIFGAALSGILFQAYLGY
ncbi:MAG: permease [Stappiaceae bacterium]